MSKSLEQEFGARVWSKSLEQEFGARVWSKNDGGFPNNPGINSRVIRGKFVTSPWPRPKQ
ncbi:MAG: hypothetical protein R2799_03925 [Crocinitomicaceae bacterium]